MNYFEYKNGELYGEGVPVAQIAQAMGTPVYIYSYKTLDDEFVEIELYSTEYTAGTNYVAVGFSRDDLMVSVFRKTMLTE